MKKNLIIIGSGHAGGMTSIILRQKKYTGSILLIGEENYVPYQRPELSKTFLDGTIQEESLYLKSSDYYKKNDIQLLRNKSVTNININKKMITLNNGETYTYDYLVIATGSKLKQINLSCNQSNIHYLRTIEDSLKIQSALKKNSSLAIIGGGYIGLEIAASFAKKNLMTTVIELEKRVMKRSSSKEISKFFQKKHEENGVIFKLNTSIVDIHDIKDKKRIVFNDETTIDTNAVAIGIGVMPNISLAHNAGIKCDNGIIVDDYCKTSNKFIYAAGDCSNHFNKIYGLRLRLESVHNAVEQAKTIALSITGKRKPYQQVPWFWSNQFDIKLQIAGISNEDSITHRIGSIANNSFSILSIKDSMLVRIEAVNDPMSFLSGKKLIKNQKRLPNFSPDKKTIRLKDFV